MADAGAFFDIKDCLCNQFPFLLAKDCNFRFYGAKVSILHNGLSPKNFS